VKERSRRKEARGEERGREREREREQAGEIRDERRVGRTEQTDRSLIYGDHTSDI